MLKWRKSVLFNKSLNAFLNVVLLFVHCGSDLSKALFLIVYLSLSTSTFLLMTSTLVKRFKYSFVKNSRSNTDSISKHFYDLVALPPFQWRYRQVLLVILFIVKLSGREYSNVAATHFTFPKPLAKWTKCTHVLIFDVNFSI